MLDTIKEWAIGLVVVGSLLGIGGILFAQMQQTSGVTQYAWDSYTENITLLCQQNVSLAKTGINPNTFHLYNASNISQEIPASNYTLYAEDGKVYLTDTTWNNTITTADYEHNYHQINTTAYQAIENAKQGTANITSNFGLIGTVVSLTAVLAILLTGIFWVYKKTQA